MSGDSRGDEMDTFAWDPERLGLSSRVGSSELMEGRSGDETGRSGAASSEVGAKVSANSRAEVDLQLIDG